MTMRVLTLLCSVLLVILLTQTATAEKDLKGLPWQVKGIPVIWQDSISIEGVVLGVRDKQARLGSYTAKFIVAMPNGKEVSVTRKVRGNDFCYVDFPSDFPCSHYLESGKYEWRGLVRDGKVAGDRFEVSHRGNYDRITIYRF